MKKLYLIFFAIMFVFLSFTKASAQNKQHYIRIANIIVDSAQLENYKAALKEGIETAVRTEPGVLALYAVYDIKNPVHITVFEIYADMNAYNLHIQTPHFKKYKSTVQNMVKSLELRDVLPVAIGSKLK